MAVSIDFNGRSALVTGGSRGIGAEIVRLLHRAGAVVHLNHLGTDDTRRDASRLAEELNALRPDSIVPREADVSDPGAVARMMAQAGSIDFLVNNAGILRDRTIAKMSIQEWREVIGTNLDGVFHCCKFGLEILRDGGAVVNIGSISARAGLHGQANYAAAKAGVQSLTRVLAREAAKRGIRANAVAPGIIETAMTATIPDEHRERMIAQIPAGRMGRPSEVASAVLFLCSDLSSYVNGHVLEVDGGWRL